MKRCLASEGKWLAAYLDGELDVNVGLRLEKHLKRCPTCREELEGMRQGRALLGCLTVPERGPTYWQVYEAKLRQKRQDPALRSKLQLPGFTLHLAWRYGLVALTLFVLSISVVSGSASPVKAEVLSNVPGASVYLDGQLTGITPLQLTLAPGSYRISLHKEGFQNWEKEVVATSLSPLRLEVRMIALGGQDQLQREGAQQFSYPSIAPNDQMLAFLGSKSDFSQGSGELWLFDYVKEEMRKIRENLAIVRPAWSPDARFLAYVVAGSSGDTLTLWDRGMSVTRSATPESDIAQLFWLNSEQVVYLAGSKGQLFLLDAKSGRQQVLWDYPVERFAPSFDGRWLAYISAVDGQVYVFSLSEGISRRISSGSREYDALGWSPNGDLAIAARDGLYLYTEGLEQETRLNSKTVIELVWIDAGNLLLREGGAESGFWEWSRERGELKLLEKEQGQIGPIAVAPDRSYMVYSASSGGFQHLWRRELQADAISRPLFPGSKLVLSSQPQGAEIHLNGQFLGRTPAVVPLEGAGSLELTIKKEEFQDWKLHFSIAEGETREIQAQLLRADFPYRPASEGDGRKNEARFSPDGKYIVLVAQSGQSAELQLIAIDSNESLDLGSGRQTAWSIDGKELYFTRGAAYSDIWVYRPGSTQFLQLTQTGGAQNPKPSPKGGWVAFLQGLEPSRLELWLMNKDGADPRLLVQPDAGQITDLAWAADGQRIAYLVEQKGQDEIWLVDLDGTQHRVAGNGSFSLPVWSGEGDFFATQASHQGKSELQIYRYPELKFYSSLAIGSEKAWLYWSSPRLEWAQQQGDSFTMYSLDLQQGLPVTGNQVGASQFLDYSPALGEVAFSSMWTGTSQLYQIPWSIQTP